VVRKEGKEIKWRIGGSVLKDCEFFGYG